MKQHLARIGHHHIAILAFLIPLFLSQAWTPWTTSWLAVVPWLVIVATAFAAVRVHMYVLCERCAADFPLDAPASAQAKRRTLRFAHAGAGFYPMVTLGAIVLTAVSRHWLPNVNLGMVLMTAVIVAQTLAMRTHSTLEPWCPFCGDDGHGDDETVIQPAPAPVVTA